MMDTSYNLSVIGIPCNQFAHQEPADNATELYNGLQYVRPGSGYIPKFKLMKKIDVNGVNETLFYKDLKESCPLPEAAIFHPKESFWDPIYPRDISWNFEKFIFDRKGRPLLRCLPKVEPADIQGILEFVGKSNLNVSHNQLITTLRNNFLPGIESKYTTTIS
ncbi:glutathione peroxidase [Mytilus galloprovincialis]|uniref:Glutathione peroxidase n=2 Tax=Mytilus galloprovincialis TaxID=29158 RepID=A0A8B6E7S7_MYTGA|nr:glutathione peroxidase [Mytilus galloprovincialis]